MGSSGTRKLGASWLKIKIMAKTPGVSGRPPKLPKPPELVRDKLGRIIKYGAAFRPHWTELEVELWCFLHGRSRERGGLGKYGHLKKAIKLVWPNLDWHEWMEWRLKKICEYSFNAWTGSGTSGKTFDSALYAMIWWLVMPNESSAILTSTTGKMIRRRMWPAIQELFDTAAKIPNSDLLCKGFPGHMVDSKTTLQSKKGDDKHGIFAIAIRDGPIHKAVDDIQGIHSKRMLVVIDEATGTPEAIFQAISNLRLGCDEFTLIISGNAESHVDPHGRICEPALGWQSITIEDEEWETKGVAEWQADPGICLHFDGIKSPNIKAGFKKHPYLYSQENLESARRGENFQETIAWWKYTRGFWAPAGICRTVFTEELFNKHDARGRHRFISKFALIAAFDPAYGGDRPVLRFAELGDLETGLMGIQLTESLEIPLIVAKGNEIHYQLADRVQAECEKRGVKPENFAMDTSGEGGGTADIISRQWSPNIVRVEFGGAPSDMPVSKEDTRLAKDAFDRKVTELYFSARNFVFGSQLKGVTDRDISELCSREYKEELRKKKLDKKDECKLKIGKSPDYADCLVVLCHLARHLGALAGGEGTPGTDKSWDDLVKKEHEIYADEAFMPQVEISYDSGW